MRLGRWALRLHLRLGSIGLAEWIRSGGRIEREGYWTATYVKAGYGQSAYRWLWQNRSFSHPNGEIEMKQVQISTYGAPESVANCVDVPDVGQPDVREVVFEVLAFPINPADIMFCRGNYRIRPSLPAVPGAECVGRVLTTGAGVTSIKPDDLSSTSCGRIGPRGGA
jgi:hypothetical protein